MKSTDIDYRHRLMLGISILAAVYVGLFLLLAMIGFLREILASPLSMSSLELSTMVEQTAADHQIQFVTNSMLSTLQEIDIDYPSSSFTFGSSYDFNDMQLDIGNSGDCATTTFTTQTLASSTGAGVWEATYNNSGNPNIKLRSSTETIAANTCVQITLFSNGTNHTLTNPSVASNTNYRIDLSVHTDTGILNALILDVDSNPNPDTLGVTANISTTVSFDLDVSTGNCNNSTETTPAQNNVAFGSLGIGNVVTSGASVNFVCIDFGTNAPAGASLYVQSALNDTNGGMEHTITTDTIPSQTANLNNVGVNQGYGIRVSDLGTEEFGTLNVYSPFDSATSASVGLVPGQLGGSAKIIDSSDPVNTSTSDRIELEFGIKIGNTTYPGDYTDSITITALENI